jgi:hypothetical protein
MQLSCNTETRQALFNVFDDLIDEPSIDSWDVMDQFPPDNSHDENGGLIFKRLCAETSTASQEEEVQLVAGPSSLPKYV